MLYMILILTFCDFHLQDLALVTDQYDDKLQWTTDISGNHKSDNILRFWHAVALQKGTASATHPGHMIDRCVAKRYRNCNPPWAYDWQLCCKKAPQLQATLGIWPTAVLQKGIATDTHSDFLRFFGTKKWLFEIFWGRFWLFEIWGRFWLFEIFWDFSGCLHYCCLVGPSDFLRFFEADSDFLRFFLARYLSL